MELRKVVITGGAGFVGFNLADELITSNQITIIHDLSTGELSNIAKINSNNNINFIRGSILNRELFEDIFRGIDIGFHQSAIGGVSLSIKGPMLAIEANIKGTLNILIGARNNNIKKVVCAPVASGYGDVSLLPAKENMILQLQSPYALTKLTVKYYCRLFTELYNLSKMCTRYFKVYEPRQNKNQNIRLSFHCLSQI